MHVIGTAGHVDHGKSALVRRLTGIDPDRLAEEKRRGLTIDLGFAWLKLPSGAEVGIVDVPGHERFIKNMLAGAGGITTCLFVVAANEGFMPQSAEHLAILDVLGTAAGVVALTKADLVDAEELAFRRLEVEERLAGTTLKGAPVVAVSALTGQGIDELVAELDRVLAGAPAPPDLGRPRLWVDRVFTIAGAGTVVTGTLAGGRFAVGDEVEVLGPGSARPRRARIRTIQSHKKEVEAIGPGNRVALNLAGLERSGAVRGDAVVAPGTFTRTATVDVVVEVLEPSLIGAEHELSAKGSHLLHTGSAETPVRLRLLGTERLGPNERGYARLELRAALPLQRGDRFVLRDAGRMLTVGGGEVLDPLPGARPQRALLERLDGAPAQDALAAVVEAEGELELARAALRTGTTTATGAIELGDRLVSAGRLERLVETLERVLAEHHRTRPLERGLARAAARAATGLSSAAFDELLGHASGVVAEGALIRLASHRVALDPAQEQARAELLARIDGAGFQPPPAKELGADPALVRALVDSGELVAIGDFYLTAPRAAEARARVRAAIDQRGPLTVAEIRDLLGTTRKYAVPLCEWLDQTGATLRRGDTRILGPTP
jgi:selenocysteine-specific elongation factor